VLDGLHALSGEKAMQPLRAGADRAKRATAGSRCSRVARQHRLGDKALGTRLSSEAKAMCRADRRRE
jgi:hypothetical protein